MQLKDLLRPDMPDAQVIVFASSMGITVPHAKHLLKKYGNNHVYSPTGIAMPYSERTVNRMRSHFAKCVVVDSEGEVWEVTKADIIRAKERAQSIEDRRDARAQAREERTRQKEHEREQMFRDGQGRPSKKRQGKADSLDDIGKYVGTGGYRSVVSECGIRSVKVFVSVPMLG